VDVDADVDVEWAGYGCGCGALWSVVSDDSFGPSFVLAAFRWAPFSLEKSGECRERVELFAQFMWL